MMNKIDAYISKHSQWQAELELLIQLLRSTEMEEHIKWGVPVYSVDGKNVVGVAAFKHYVGLWFYQGVFLKDKAKVLHNAQEGKTKALRQWRFNGSDEIDQKLVLAYVKEAIDNQKQGKELKPQKKALIIPEELNAALKQDVKLNAAFDAFSPSHQREYADYISEAKKEATRLRRLEKIIPMIKEKQGLHDKYK